MLAIHLLNAGKNGVAALELSRTLGIGYRAAWFMAHRIRYGIAPVQQAAKFTGTVEADETYIGGKRKGKRGRGAAGKTPVVTLIERGGEARSQAMVDVTGANMKAVLHEQVAEQAVIMTDTPGVYGPATQGFAAHEAIDHTKDMYAQDSEHGRVHINTAEGYFSQLKRSIDGTHHHVSARHLHRYLAEFDYRYNTRKVKDGGRTVTAIRKMAGKRLKY